MKTQEEEFGEEVRALLDEVASEAAPSSAVKDRIRERVEASLGQPTGSGGGAEEAAVASSGSVGPMVALVCAAIGVTAIVMVSVPEDAAAPPAKTPIVRSAPSKVATIAPGTTTPVGAEGAAGAGPGTETGTETETETGTETGAETETETGTETGAETETETGTETETETGAETETELDSQPTDAVAVPGDNKDLRVEQALLDKARAAVSVGQPRRAWKHLRKHRRQFPRGALVEEREGLWIQTLKATGKPKAAHKRATRFLKRFPRSSLRRIVEKALME